MWLVKKKGWNRPIKRKPRIGRFCTLTQTIVAVKKRHEVWLGYEAQGSAHELFLFWFRTLYDVL